MYKKSSYILLICLLVCLSHTALAQTDTTLISGDMKKMSPAFFTSDTLAVSSLELDEQVKQKESFKRTKQTDTLVLQQDTLPVQNIWKPNPLRAVWMGAVIPGYGQIHNRQYWKLPIVYGGFMGCAYAIGWNGKMYNDYRGAYYDIIDSDPTTDSYLDILPEGYTIASIGGEAAFKQILETKQSTYRRYRDMSILATIAFYALTLIDAYVDAELYDFDISPNLSMQVQPILYNDQYNNQRSAELQMSMKF